ncbi:unnamed protein product [Linum tenue]|uniref:Uncharacterized protein n=1 Tax=Linum tenue TaxID=586396 RepID=A0AAV0HY36_9ROSI|nr:unnamed protein product [Linum tenue]
MVLPHPLSPPHTSATAAFCSALNSNPQPKLDPQPINNGGRGSWLDLLLSVADQRWRADLSIKQQSEVAAIEFGRAVGGGSRFLAERRGRDGSTWGRVSISVREVKQRNPGTDCDEPFSRVAQNGRCLFFENVALGSSISLSEIRTCMMWIFLGYTQPKNLSSGTMDI